MNFKKPKLSRIKCGILSLTLALSFFLGSFLYPEELQAESLSTYTAEDYAALAGDLAELQLSSPLVGVYYEEPNGEIVKLYAVRENELHPPASLCKLMTIFIAAEVIEEQGIDLNTTYEIQLEDYAGLYENNIAACGFLAGDKLTIKDLLCGTLIASGADAVNGLISALEMEEDDFVGRMSLRARELGLDLYFTDAVGLYSPGQLVTIEGIVGLMQEIFRKPLLKEIMNYKSYTFPPLQNFPEGRLIEHSMDFYARELGLDTALIQGGKTGWIGQSGYNLATFQDLTEGRLIIVSMAAEQAGQHVLDHLDILTTLGEKIYLPRAELVNMPELRAKIKALRAGGTAAESKESAEVEPAELSSVAVGEEASADEPLQDAGEEGSSFEDSAENTDSGEALKWEQGSNLKVSASEKSSLARLKKLNLEEKDNYIELPWVFILILGLLLLVLILFSLEIYQKKKQKR